MYVVFMMNGKLIAIVLVCLLIGIGAGFATGFAVKIRSFFVDYEALDNKYSQLNDDYANLQDDYEQLEGNYSTLQNQYSELIANYTLLKSVNYTFDSSVQISDLTIDVGAYTTYVRGNVTNVGNTSIKHLFIFVFHFNADGSLTGCWDGYNYEYLENLYPNETLPFEISFSTVEGQMFKIFAVGNY